MEGTGRYVFMALVMALFIFAGYMNYKEDKEEFKLVMILLLSSLALIGLMMYIGWYW